MSRLRKPTTRKHLRAVYRALDRFERLSDSYDPNAKWAANHQRLLGMAMENVHYRLILLRDRFYVWLRS